MAGMNMVAYRLERAAREGEIWRRRGEVERLVRGHIGERPGFVVKVEKYEVEVVQVAWTGDETLMEGFEPRLKE